jgi:2,5-diamino-6-(ribosylamino)-4(3H)-pyrimidinone 5'-phosphate reductase
MEKPITTLFMLMSVDGKISTGNIYERDVDKDYPKIDGIRDGLKQYYEIEQTTDLFSMNSGKVVAKVGANIKKENVKKN